MTDNDLDVRLRELVAPARTLAVDPAALRDARTAASSRRRVRAAGAGGAVMALVVGAVLIGLAATDRASRGDVLFASDPPPAPSATAVASGAPTGVSPSWLPPGTKLLRVDNDAAGITAVYTLPGPANQPAADRPAGLLLVALQPGATEIPELPPGRTARPAVVAGHPAALTDTGDERPGLVQVDWVDSAGLHSVRTQRDLTPSGLSGLTATDVLAVAESLYPS